MVCDTIAPSAWTETSEVLETYNMRKTNNDVGMQRERIGRSRYKAVIKQPSRYAAVFST